MDAPKRPDTPESGVPLEKECNIQHRSDLLMEHHIDNVKQTQEELRFCLIDLENAKNEDGIEELRIRVNELREKSELQMTTLQVMLKLNTELSFARADLNEALYNGNGDINTARKRVIWLEDRMGALCGKKRIKSRPSIHQLPVFIEPTGHDDEYEISVSKDGEYKEPIGRDVQVKSKVGDSLRLAINWEGSAFSTDPEPSPQLRYMSSLITPDTTLSMVEAEFEEKVRRQEKSREENKLADIEVEKESSDESSEYSQETEESEESERGRSESGGSEDQRGSTMAVFQDSTEEGDVESVSKLGLASDQRLMAVQKDDTFLTEVTDTPKSKVTIQTPGSLEKAQTFPVTEKDLATSYWETEHHRFEKSDFSQVLCELDPSSYHSVPLAVPGNFITREESCPDFSTLPWSSNLKDTEIKDIHRIALDKLALKVHGLYDKVYNAAMLSVRESRKSEDLPREASIFMRRESNLSSKDTKEDSSSPSGDDSRQKKPVSLPKIQQRRGGTSSSRHLVYYPKPIPPPEVLPITRTNKSHEFPKFASFYGKPDAAQLEPAERIVDQRNLLEETKLVLYREKKKPKKNVVSTNERRFRRMIEREKTASSKTSSREDLFGDVEEPAPINIFKKLKKTFTLAKSMAQLKGGISGWPLIKPKTRGNEYGGLRWERVKGIVHNNLMSKNPEERKDAAKQLGMLRCGDTMVFYALKERLTEDEDMRVSYESAKSLILIGCWEEDVLQVVLKFLVIGNSEIRSDLIQTMMNGKNVQYVNKTLNSFTELVKILSHFCQNPDPNDPISFEAAVLLGRLCVADANAKKKLKDSLDQSGDTHIKSKALEVLVKQLNCTDADVVHSVQELLRTSPCWKHRELAAKLLISLGPGHTCVIDDYENIFNLLERKLWDDPNSEVRISSAKALTALGMFSRGCELTEKKLEDPEEDVRAQAAVAVGTLGMKSEKLTRLLLEMLELDASEYVRLMIVRSIATLKLADKRVIRTLREREKLDGPLARESKKTLQILETSLSVATPKTWTPKVMTPPTRGSKILV